MTLIAAADDPIEVQAQLWDGFWGGLAFEVGANVGRALPHLTKRFGRVIGFEPYLPAYKVVAESGADIRNTAISDHDGTVTLRLHRDQFMSQGHEAFNRENPAERLNVWEEHEVACLTLDTVAAKEGYPDFVNLDCEGHELKVLKGASRIIKEKPPSWLIEFHSHKLYDDCTDFLKKAGYEVETVRHPHYPKGSVNWFQHGWIRAHPQGHKDMKLSLLMMAKSRPYYLQSTLTSWALADGANEILSDVVVALGRSPREMDQRNVVKQIVPGARIWLDSDRANASNGVGRAMGEAADRIFIALKPDFLIITEEDIVVSSDTLRYMKWAAEKFRDDPRVLCVLAHNVGAAGWDEHKPAQDQDASQDSVRLLPYYNPWCWGTWADRWEKVLSPQWDWECNSGGAMDSGQDWNIATRIVPKGNYLCVVPDASRSQNIGRLEGWASNEESWSFSQSQSFRDKREISNYKLEEN